MNVSPTRCGERRVSGGRRSGRRRATFAAAAILPAMILAGVTSGYSQLLHHEEKPKEAVFKYAGGTEKIPDGCIGRLEVAPDNLDFACFQYDIAVPYSSIHIMEYRPNVSRRVWKLRPKWKVRPMGGGGGKLNRYFTVAFAQGGKTHVMVLEVLPDAMRPYLAEIDLKAGRRVEVMGYEDYENNE